MGARMIALHYHADDDRHPLSRDELVRKITGGVSHVYVSNTQHQMEWRLQAVGYGEGRGGAAVSFLSARSKAPFTRRFLEVAKNEFHRIAADVIDVTVVDQALNEALRTLDKKDSSLETPAPKVSSDIHTSVPTNSTRGEYAIKVRIEQWQQLPELVHETYSGEVIIYFVYLPPDQDVDLTQVSSGGFAR